ncbi:hypothetical protein ACIBCP_23425 [Streptomyces sp. NPDC051287]|uniref:hypothetical protein n=1 Tax=Streptomyces sp. NPDC051287 TaxID=3365648 RepID=UPI0037AD5D5F
MTSDISAGAEGAAPHQDRGVDAAGGRTLFSPRRLGEPRRYADPSRAVQQPGSDVMFPPIENGLDYLISVVDNLAKEDGTPVSARNLKYGVLHLQAAAEVLLKARLQREHWSLVLAKLDRNPTTRENFDAGKFASCTMEDAALRLRNVVGLHISPESIKALKELAESRNALQHFGLDDTGPAVEAKAALVLDFLIRFLDEHLLPDLNNEERERTQDDMERIRVGLTHIQAFVDRRMESVRAELASHLGRTLECPGCHQFGLLVDGGEDIKCYFCGRKKMSGDAALEYVFYVLGRWWDGEGRTPVEECPHCSSDSLVWDARALASPQDSIDLCFHCGVVADTQAVEPEGK